MNVVRVDRPEAFDLQEMKDLFQRAFRIEDHADGDEVREWVRDHLNPSVRVYVSVDSAIARLRGLMILDDGVHPLSPHVFVSHFYAETHEDAEALAAAGREWLSSTGRKRFLAINRTGHTDRGYRRWMRVLGFRAERLGALFELEDAT